MANTRNRWKPIQSTGESMQRLSRPRQPTSCSGQTRCQFGVMCGRRPRVKGSFRCQLAVGCKSCVRPVCAAHMAAGPDGSQSNSRARRRVTHKRVFPIPGSHHAIITLDVPLRSRRDPTFPLPSPLCARRNRSAACVHRRSIGLALGQYRPGRPLCPTPPMPVACVA